MFTNTKIANSLVAAFGALLLSTACLAGALAPTQPLASAAHVIA
jgi:hypothetical protein